MSFFGKPEHNERVEKHGEWCSPLDRIAGPALWLLEPKMLLAVTEGHFDAPSHGIPGHNLLGAGFVTGGVEPFPPTASANRRAGHDP